MKKKVRCSCICVDCVANTLADAYYDAPEYYGFVFFVDRSKTNEMLMYVIDTLNYYEIPFIELNVNESRSQREDQVWTKERIESAISRDADFLKRKAGISLTRKKYME